MIGIKNVSFSTDSVNYKPICSTTEIDLNILDTITPEYNIDEPISYTFTIHKKRKGNLIEKCLYYKNNKKKRIRKKWDMIRILEKGR